MLAGFFAKPPELFDEWGRLRVPPGMMRLSYSYGMRHGGYYDEYHTAYEVSEKVFMATPAWTPASLQPIPLETHEAYAIYLKWRKTQPEDDEESPAEPSVKLSAKTLPGEHYFKATPEHRWYYTIGGVIILLDGTLVTPRIVDLRTDEQKQEYEERVRKRKEQAQNCCCKNGGCVAGE